MKLRIYASFLDEVTSIIGPMVRVGRTVTTPQEAKLRGLRLLADDAVSVEVRALDPYGKEHLTMVLEPEHVNALELPWTH